MDYTVHVILQAKILECVAFPFPKGSSQSRDEEPLEVGASQIAQLLKNLPAMQKTPVRFLDEEDPLEKS